MLSLFGKILIFIGVLLIFLGLIFSFSEKIPFLGRLPGDILIKKENFTFYFPLGTSILISVVLSIVFSLISKFFK
jgi:hypothetical protein